MSIFTCIINVCRQLAENILKQHIEIYIPTYKHAIYLLNLFEYKSVFVMIYSLMPLTPIEKLHGNLGKEIATILHTCLLAKIIWRLIGQHKLPIQS